MHFFVVLVLISSFFRSGQNIRQYTFVHSILTVLHPCDDRIRVQRFTNSKLVDSRDSELVLIALNKVGGIERTSLALRCDHGPGDPGCLPLLDHIVRDGSTAVVLWWVPPHCALFSRDASETDRALNRPRGVFGERGKNIIDDKL